MPEKWVLEYSALCTVRCSSTSTYSKQVTDPTERVLARVLAHISEYSARVLRGTSDRQPCSADLHAEASLQCSGCGGRGGHRPRLLSACRTRLDHAGSDPMDTPQHGINARSCVRLNGTFMPCCGVGPPIRVAPTRLPRDVTTAAMQNILLPHVR